MGQARQRAAILASRDIISVSELEKPEESLRQFLDRLPDERIASRFMAGMDRAGALDVYREIMEEPRGDVFVMRDGQGVAAVLDIIRHSLHSGLTLTLCEVSLLCGRGDHARRFFRYLRALHPRDYLIASPRDKLSPPMYRFMMRHLDAILPCPMRSWSELFCRKEGEDGFFGPIVPVWERTPLLYNAPSPLNTLLSRAPLSKALIAAARSRVYFEALQFMGHPGGLTLAKHAGRRGRRGQSKRELGTHGYLVAERVRGGACRDGSSDGGNGMNDIEELKAQARRGISQ